MTKIELIEKLKAKVNTEWKEYEDSLYRMDVDSIITMSYETVMKEQICCVLESETEDMLEEQQIEKLLSINNLLDFMYQEWLNFDGSENDILKECIYSDRTMERVNDYEM